MREGRLGRDKGEVKGHRPHMDAFTRILSKNLSILQRDGAYLVDGAGHDSHRVKAVQYYRRC